MLSQQWEERQLLIFYLNDFNKKNSPNGDEMKFQFFLRQNNDDYTMLDIIIQLLLKQK